MSFLKTMRKLSIHFLVYILIVGLIMAFSVLIFKFGPPKIEFYDYSWSHLEPYIPETNTTYSVLFDQHSHTKYSDGRLTVKQNIEWHITMGFTAVAITDHNTLSNSDEIKLLAEEYKKEIIVIQGMEWTTRRIHLNFIGISEWHLKIPINPTDIEIQEAIIEVHNQNGIVTANHLPFTERTIGNKMPTKEDLLLWGVDFIEIVNGMDFDEKSYSFYLENNETIGLITGTDMHSPDSSEGGRVYAWTTLNTDNFSKTAIMAELRDHNTSFIVNQMGVEIQGIHKISATYIALQPFYELGEGLVFYYFRYDNVKDNFNRVIVSVFIVYSFGIFILIEFLLYLRNVLKYKHKKKLKSSLK